MISNLSLSAFSAVNLRPTEPRTAATPVQPTPSVDRVRAQSETRPTDNLSTIGRNPPQPTPGKPAPRGSLLDLSV